MFCNECGTDNKDDARFCRNCAAPLIKAEPAQPPSGSSSPYDPSPGAPGSYQDYGASGGYGGYQPGQSVMPSPPSYPGYQDNYGGYNPPAQGNASPRAIASMIMSLISIATCGPLLSVPGAIMGKMELNDIAAGRASKAGETFAKIGYYAGLVLSILYLIGIVLYILVIIFALASGGVR